MNRNRKGFTLVELLIVIAILGILSSVSLGMFTGSIVKGKDSKRKSDIGVIAKAMEAFKNDYGKYPDDDGNGGILGCMEDASTSLTKCPTSSGKWKVYKGNDTTREITYLVSLPADADVKRSYRYEYNSANDTFSLFAALENTQDKDVKRESGKTSPDPAGWGNACGSSTCNYKVTESGLVLN